MSFSKQLCSRLFTELLAGSQSLAAPSALRELVAPSSPAGAEEVDLLLKAGKGGVRSKVDNPPVPGGEAPPLVFRTLKNTDDDSDDSDDLLNTGEEVLLHVYDLNNGFRCANKVTSGGFVAMGGAFHVGVEAFGSEWSYGCCGVDATAPLAVHGNPHAYNCTIRLGRTLLDRAAFTTLIWSMCQQWRGGNYELFGKNCCSFASEFSRRLGVQQVPDWVTFLPRLLHAGQRAGSAVLAVGHAAHSVVSRETTLCADDSDDDASDSDEDYLADTSIQCVWTE